MLVWSREICLNQPQNINYFVTESEDICSLANRSLDIPAAESRKLLSQHSSSNRIIYNKTYSEHQLSKHR